MTFNIKDLAEWGTPERIETRAGPRLLAKAPAGEKFWTAWREDKEACKAAGLSVTKSPTGNWKACWWMPLDSAAKLEQVKTFEQEQAALADALNGKPAILLEKYELALEAVAPKLMPWQSASVRRMVNALYHYNSVVDASDTGVGKTYAALAAVAVMGLKAFIVCPKAVIPGWKRAAAHFNVELAGACNYELLKRGNTPALEMAVTKTVVKGKEKTKREFNWLLPVGTVIIFDECHRMKDSSTQNCQMGMAALRQGYPVAGLSATLASNPMQMKFAAMTAKLIKSESQFFGWMLRNGVRKGQWGFEFTGGQSALVKIHHQIFPMHGTRVRIKDLGDAFPETQITAQAYDLNGAGQDIQAAYDEMEVAIAKLEASEAQDKNACILTEILRARQRSELLKVPAIVEMAQDAVEEGNSVAIFVNFQETMDAMLIRLNTQCCIRGGQKPEEREAFRVAFQEDRERIIVCNIQAGGVGIDLHGGKPESNTRLAIICPTQSAQNLKQALGRVWRAKGAKSIQRIFFALGTIEEKVCRSTDLKVKNIDTLNDGDLSLPGEAAYQLAQRQEEFDQANAAESVAGETVTTATSAATRKETVSGNREAKPIITYPQNVIDFARKALQQLTAMNQDHASIVNGKGFNKVDGEFGAKLAELECWTPRQAMYAVKLANKYRGQTGELPEGWNKE